MSTSAGAARPASLTTNDLGPLPAFLRPFVDWVARLPTTVHIKLLAGFGVIAILLFSMGIVCVGVLNRVNHQVETLTALNEQASQARDMIYDVTAQSHYRAMALITRDDVQAASATTAQTYPRVDGDLERAVQQQLVSNTGLERRIPIAERKRRRKREIAPSALPCRRKLRQGAGHLW